MIPYIQSSFRGGISDENDKGVIGSFKYGHGLDIHGIDDVLTGKQAMQTVFDATNTTQTGIMNVFVNSSNGTTYAFGSTGSIFARNGNGLWYFVYNDENGAIKGAYEWQLSDGTKYMYWATNTSIARKEIGGAEVALDSGAARWTDVTADYKTTLDGADSHMMTQASGDLMIANNNAIATIDFGGDFNALNLNIRPGNVINALDERDDYVIIGSGRTDNSEQGYIWSWISTAVNWIQKKLIPVKGVNALINTEFMLLQGGSDGEIFFSDFVNAVPLHGVPGGGQVAPHGVAVENDLAAFGFYGGTYPGVWTYGRKRKNRPHALNYAYRLAKTVAGSTISTISALTMIDGTLHVSWGTTDGSTSEYGIDAVDANTKADATFESLEFDATQPHLNKHFDTIKLTHDPLVSGTSISVRYKFNKATTGGDSSAGAGWKYAITGSNATTYAEEGSDESMYTISGSGSKIEVAVDLNASSNDSPKIHSVVTYMSNNSYDHA